MNCQPTRTRPSTRTTANPGREKEVSGVTRRHTPDPLPCRRFDSELWFAEKPEDVELAKSLCQECPLQTACLAGALEREEPWGVWGGQLVLAGGGLGELQGERIAQPEQRGDDEADDERRR